MDNNSTDLFTKNNALTPCNLGMTLVELLVVVAIVGILAVVVIPSFQNQITQARRGSGISNLLQLKIQQETYRTENISYASTQQLTMPSNDYYQFSVTNASATTYTIIASAIGSQKEDTHCITMSLDQSMNQTPLGCFK